MPWSVEPRPRLALASPSPAPARPRPRDSLQSYARPVDTVGTPGAYAMTTDARRLISLASFAVAFAVAFSLAVVSVFC